MSAANTPIRVGKFTLKNRITMAPTVKFDWATEEGYANDLFVSHYGLRAEAGFGLVCVEATAVLPGGRFCKRHMGLYEDGQIEEHRRITEACHKYDCVVIIQLNHAGAVGNPEVGEPIGPSAIPTRSGALSRALTVEEIHEVQKAYVEAAVRAKKAGYDGIQLHACHGYLVNQFVSPKTNLRTDEYGGSVENRARFGAEIIAGIRKACGENFLISARTTGFDPDVESGIQVAEAYVTAGCDYLQISGGIEDYALMPQEPGCPFDPVAQLAITFRKHFNGRVPVSCVRNFFTPEDINAILDADLVDTVDLARASLADPAICGAVLNGTEYVKCFQCKACFYGPFTSHKCPADRVRAKKFGTLPEQPANRE